MATSADAEVAVALRVAASDAKTSRSGSPTRAGAARSRRRRRPTSKPKLDGLQTPRGWGLFLIQNMVDDMEVDER